MKTEITRILVTFTMIEVKKLFHLQEQNFRHMLKIKKDRERTFFIRKHNMEKRQRDFENQQVTALKMLKNEKND